MRRNSHSFSCSQWLMLHSKPRTPAWMEQQASKLREARMCALQEGCAQITHKPNYSCTQTNALCSTRKQLHTLCSTQYQTICWLKLCAY